MKLQTLLLPSMMLFLLGWAMVGCRPAEAPLPTQLPTAVAVSTFTPAPTPTQTLTPTPTLTAVPTETPVIQRPSATPLPTDTPAPTATTPALGITRTIGFSGQERPIVAYQFKNGPTQLVYVGGIHGGYEWNTILLAYEAIDYFLANPELIPDSVTLHIIPSANPDGQALVTGGDGRFSLAEVADDTVPGRFNANRVDLNRNWDCQWQRWGLWRDISVSGGEAPFSEPENQVLRDYFLELTPDLVVFWHSALNGVFAAGCGQLHQPSYQLATIFGLASGYPIYEGFTAYPISGDASDWLSMQGISSFAVELKNHDDLDWPQNLAGMQAIFTYFE